MSRDVRNAVLRTEETITVNEHEGIPCGTPFVIRAAVRGERRRPAFDLKGFIARLIKREQPTWNYPAGDFPLGEYHVAGNEWRHKG